MSDGSIDTRQDGGEPREEKWRALARLKKAGLEEAFRERQAHFKKKVGLTRHEAFYAALAEFPPSPTDQVEDDFDGPVDEAPRI